MGLTEDQVFHIEDTVFRRPETTEDPVFFFGRLGLPSGVHGVFRHLAPMDHVGGRREDFVF